MLYSIESIDPSIALNFSFCWLFLLSVCFCGCCFFSKILSIEIRECLNCSQSWARDFQLSNRMYTIYRLLIDSFEWFTLKFKCTNQQTLVNQKSWSILGIGLSPFLFRQKNHNCSRFVVWSWNVSTWHEHFQFCPLFQLIVSCL